MIRYTLAAVLSVVCYSRGMAATGSASGRQSASEIEDIGEIAEASGDAKAEAPVERPNHFRFSVGTRAQYTSNAELHGDHSSSDVVFFPSIEAGFNTKLGRYFSFDSALRVETGAYVDHSDRSFIGYSLQNTLDFRPRPNLPRIFIGAEPYRYDSFDRGSRITEAIALSAGTDYGYAFNHGNTVAFAGYTFADHIADPGKDSRYTNSVVAGITHAFNPKLYGQLFYQFEYSDFYHYDRDDRRQVAGVSFTYQFTKRLFGTLSGNFVNNDSSDDRASYQSAGASLGVNLQY